MTEEKTISAAEIDGRIVALTNQRNEANDRIVLLSGMLAVAQQRIKELEAKQAKDEG